MPNSLNYLSIPALKTYIERIGAEELNFRKYMVKLYHGSHYYREKCLISIKGDGTIHVTDPDYAPTDEEAAAIKLAYQNQEFPTAVHATEALVAQLRATRGNEGFYVFYNRTRNAAEGNVIMLQQRVMIAGRKAYIPWTYWSDGEWRCMEPEGTLPIWKPRDPTNRNKHIMMHEGAKVAQYVHELVNDPAKADLLAVHPWRDELVMYEHWGMIGGALAPHRTDYTDLHREKLNELVYVCDADFPGKEALKVISQKYNGKLKGVVFRDKFPTGWDMADPLPQNLFGDDGYWLGPTIKTLSVPATWATEKYMNGGKKPATKIRNDFSEEWFHAIDPEVYIHKDWPNIIYNAKSFNNLIAPFTDVEETDRLVKKVFANKTGVIKYSPAYKAGVWDDENGRVYINTHVPSNIKAMAGDFTPWTDFMAHLIEDPYDRVETLRWVATLIARPEIKMQYGILLISETQGVGKSTLGEKILGPLLGEENVSAPSERQITESGFNEWAAHKRLAVIHEIYAGHSSKAYDNLKSIITERTIEVNKKYQSTYKIENWLHFFACSNSPRALKLSFDDRRWFVPKVTSRKKPAEYWIMFNNWLSRKHGLNIIKYWADEWLRANSPVVAGMDAPDSATKRDMILDGYSAGQTLVSNFLEKARETVSPEAFILDVDLVQLIKDRIYEGRITERLEKPATVRKVAKAQNWHVGDKRIFCSDWGLSRQYAKIIALNSEVAALDGATLVQRGLTPLDVTASARLWLDV